MSKDTEIRVKAECVDVRSGKRFLAGDNFSPLPTEEQAKRLFAAGCLPEEAIAIAKANDAETEKARKATIEQAAKRQAQIAARLAANNALDSAKDDLGKLQTVLSEAAEADKPAAAKNVEVAQKRVADAEAAVKKLDA